MPKAKIKGSIKAEVLYYPNPWFGHVEVKTQHILNNQKTLNNSASGSQNNYRTTALSGGCIAIELPVIDTEEITSLKNIHSSPYHFLLNNCADETQNTLHKFGYFKTKPWKFFILRPYTVARQACFLAQEMVARKRKETLKSKDSREKIKALIDCSIDRLKAERSQQLASHLPIDVAKKDEKIKSLKDISDKVNKTLDFEEQLIYTAKTIKGRTAKELQECIDILSPKARAEANLKALIKCLSEKADAKCATDLAAALNENYRLLMRAPDNKNKLKILGDCEELIDGATLTLEKHQGYGQLLANITLAILGLGVFYLAAISVNKIYTGRFLFFTPESLICVEDIQQALKSPDFITKPA